MQQKKTYKLVGVFVLLGLLGFGALIANYVQKNMLKKNAQYVVMYFEESISGLNVGSPVVFKGVEVGKVAQIKLFTNLEQGTFKVPVFVSFKENRSFQISKDESISGETLLEGLIKRGLRAKLVSANYLTGQLMIELDLEPNMPIVMRGNGDYLEIPTVISSIGMVSRDLQEIPMKEIILETGNVIKSLDEKLPAILDNMGKVTDKIEVMLKSKSDETTRVLNNINASLYDLNQTGKAVRNLADYLEQNPEAIVWGKGK